MSIQARNVCGIINVVRQDCHWDASQTRYDQIMDIDIAFSFHLGVILVVFFAIFQSIFSILADVKIRKKSQFYEFSFPLFFCGGAAFSDFTQRFLSKASLITIFYTKRPFGRNFRAIWK